MKLFSRNLVRSLEGENLLEIFFVTAVASVLAIRFFLALAGYPKLSPGNLHIAHVLLGGALMMIALIIALGFINKPAYYLAATLGGIGFGAFIDELGKFITGDNNYFYQPTVALIYITFILLYLGIQQLMHGSVLSEQEKLINALEIAKEVVMGDLDHRERKTALKLLRECQSANPVTRALRELLYAADPVPVPRPDIYTRVKYHARKTYRRLLQKSWFISAVIVFFLLQSFLPLLLLIFVIYAGLGGWTDLEAIFSYISFVDLAGLASATLAAVFAVIGIFKIQSDRLVAYQFFKNAVLIQIFLLQVFLFYIAQLPAILGLAGDICVLLVLHYMIRQEAASREANGNMSS
ncbi:Uncharacterised protein [uncultured archaeon]|nr:Uncharacterised protein [uncultured archaeon]